MYEKVTVYKNDIHNIFNHFREKFEKMSPSVIEITFLIMLCFYKHCGNAFKEIELTRFNTHNDRTVVNKIIISAKRTSALFDSNPLEAVITLFCLYCFCFHFRLLKKRIQKIIF